MPAAITAASNLLYSFSLGSNVEALLCAPTSIGSKSFHGARFTSQRSRCIPIGPGVVSSYGEAVRSGIECRSALVRPHFNRLQEFTRCKVYIPKVEVHSDRTGGCVFVWRGRKIRWVSVAFLRSSCGRRDIWLRALNSSGCQRLDTFLGLRF